MTGPTNHVFVCSRCSMRFASEPLRVHHWEQVHRRHDERVALFWRERTRIAVEQDAEDRMRQREIEKARRYWEGDPLYATAVYTIKEQP